MCLTDNPMYMVDLVNSKQVTIINWWRKQTLTALVLTPHAQYTVAQDDDIVDNRTGSKNGDVGKHD